MGINYGTAMILSKTSVFKKYKSSTGNCSVMMLGRQTMSLINDNQIKVTISHEFFHTIQYAYFDETKIDYNKWEKAIWWLEATSVLMEDEVYNDVNDYLQEIPEAGTGIYAIDLRGAVGSGGGSVSTGTNTEDGNVESDTLFWNATTGIYEPKTLQEARDILQTPVSLFQL